MSKISYAINWWRATRATCYRFQEAGYEHLVGYDISPDGSNPERDDYRKVILEEILISSLKINPDFDSKEIQNYNENY